MIRKGFLFALATLILSGQASAQTFPKEQRDFSSDIISFLKRPEIVSVVQSIKPRNAMGGARISTMDFTGEGVPEIVLYEMIPYYGQAFDMATVYDLHSYKKLTSFCLGGEGKIEGYTTKEGRYICLVRGNIYKDHSRVDTIITEVRTESEGIIAQVKFLFECLSGYDEYSSEGMRLKYYVFKDLSEETMKKYFENPYVNPEEYNPVYLKEYWEYTQNFEKSDNEWKQIGTFWTPDKMTPEVGCEKIANAIADTYKK